ncbi:MAG: hypothetical protein RXQ80_00215 [Sulfolobaceae archaeon]|jgi:hypothetical protein|nr:hypothetical protein [Sulfolobaceae archaeon]
MSSRWIPRWKTIEIQIDDKKVEVCFDEVSKLYACPLCTPICKKGGIPDYGTYFFSVDDLKEHLIAHGTAYWTKKIKVEEEEEEEKVKVLEEEEEENEE